MSSPGRAPTAVVHLVRHVNGFEPFEAFLESYTRHHAGQEHDLVLLFKGFESTAALAPYRSKAAYLAVSDLTVSDDGYDLTAYLAAARQLPHRRLCFLNSFARILAPGWLKLLSAALDQPGAGVAGATGSWGSHRSFALSLLRLPNGYHGSLGNRAAIGPALRSVSPARDLGLAQRLLRAARDIPRVIAGHPGFPSPHVRTNAFLIERELLLSLNTGRLGTKSAAYRFESGHGGMTEQLRARGLKPLMVGRDGIAWAPEDWPEAEVFWQGSQRGLLIGDNQTRSYDEGDPTTRAALGRYAWGPKARPG